LWENILPKTCLTAENRNKTGKLSEETWYRWYLLLMITILVQFSVVFIRSIHVINDKRQILGPISMTAFGYVVYSLSQKKFWGPIHDCLILTGCCAHEVQLKD
jgi:hypothetical protein